MKILSNTDDLLYYLVHDKNHVLQPGVRNMTLDKLIVSRCKKPLYRGLSRYELKLLTGKPVGSLVTAPTYWSASESRSVAKSFATQYKTNVVVKFTNAKAFCLWTWGVKELENLKYTNLTEYESSDGDFLNESYKEESEWILGFNTFRVMSVSNNGVPLELLDITQ